MIRRHGGNPFVAPSVKEFPFEQHMEVFRWAERLFVGEFDLGVATLERLLIEHRINELGPFGRSSTGT